MYEFGRAVAIAAITINPLLAAKAEIPSETIDHIKQSCSEQLLPEEKLTLWIFTGSTSSSLERRCYAQLMHREVKSLQDSAYFERQLFDSSFRTLKSPHDIDEGTIATLNSSKVASEVSILSGQNETPVPITTLNRTGYRSIRN